MRSWPLVAVTGLACAASLSLAGTAAEPPTIVIEDYVELPVTGKVDGVSQVERYLARLNTLREEPGGAPRLFINDLNGPLYIIDKRTKRIATYLDFNGLDGRSGLFRRLMLEAGSGMGFSSFQFDPAYRRNGRFYTVHMENPAIDAPNVPDARAVPGLRVAGYTTTAPVLTPGPVMYEAVVIEWTDTEIRNATFEGTARELLRVQLNTRTHPMGEVTFNPMARQGDPDWRVLYIAVGDGGSGESRTPMRSNPQRLDNLVGKILRIVPDLSEHVGTSVVSENGRYRIPGDNPFVSVTGARKEIWAYGLRNAYRLNWAVDENDSRNSRLVATNIGVRTWETVLLVSRGGNYGFPLREGNQMMRADNSMTDLPEIDRIPVLIGEAAGDATITPRYPVVQYGHVPGGGDAIGSGYLYTGKAIPELRGRYLFTDLTTGRVWCANYAEMLAADDGDPQTMAPMQEVKIRWRGEVYDALYPVAMASYHARGGKDPDLPGAARISGAGRADIRFGVDASGELYLFGKSDATVRRVVAAAGF